MVPIRISAGDLEQIEDEEVNENLPQNISIPKQGEILLSHIPLVWMVPEAQRAGLRFDSNKVAEMDFSWIGNKEDFIGSGVPPAPGVPQVQATATEPTQINDKTKQRRDKFRNHLHRAAIESIAHNCLTFGGGLEIGADSAWTFMNICLSVGWTLSLTKPGEVFVFPCPVSCESCSTLL